uniref:MMPL family protein n=1 Tax=Candidatus Kentrum sp. LFY TaxID=2126342 RepID=A0A450WGJ1_9GAMM|nr:MAG: MMPL family protein [Candidatus Kentron sp. LFY]
MTEPTVPAAHTNLQPISLTSLTTAICFLGVNFSGAPPFRDLGNIVAMGVIIAFVLSITFLPALMAILPLPDAVSANTTRAMNRLGEFVVKRYRVLIWTMTGTALVLISIILIIALRSLKFGLISLIPNLLPVAMAFGVWGILVGEVDLVLSGVAVITIGIVVDDTIHFLSKYLRAGRERDLAPPGCGTRRLSWCRHGVMGNLGGTGSRFFGPWPIRLFVSTPAWAS